ncbi:hypothetical protein [Candidatus Phytoplasma sp. AldY-WA1]|uniref:hypothetical protein n=1 Tax=Candidatus Phytoplasma sp. AldY-WA1 TaxID=2852100 RepID=UPI00254A2E47|nr:hypothetical protein [Candidatus Phytoplasma sp. AldY-WA1]
MIKIILVNNCNFNQSCKDGKLSKDVKDITIIKKIVQIFIKKLLYNYDKYLK